MEFVRVAYRRDTELTSSTHLCGCGANPDQLWELYIDVYSTVCASSDILQILILIMQTWQ